jgi:hypothetical protein
MDDSPFMYPSLVCPLQLQRRAVPDASMLWKATSCLVATAGSIAAVVILCTTIIYA